MANDMKPILTHLGGGYAQTENGVIVRADDETIQYAGNVEGTIQQPYSQWHPIHGTTGGSGGGPGGGQSAGGIGMHSPTPPITPIIIDEAQGADYIEYKQYGFISDAHISVYGQGAYFTDADLIAHDDTGQGNVILPFSLTGMPHIGVHFHKRRYSETIPYRYLNAPVIYEIDEDDGEISYSADRDMAYEDAVEYYPEMESNRMVQDIVERMDSEDQPEVIPHSFWSKGVAIKDKHWDLYHDNPPGSWPKQWLVAEFESYEQYFQVPSSDVPWLLAQVYSIELEHWGWTSDPAHMDTLVITWRIYGVRKGSSYYVLHEYVHNLGSGWYAGHFDCTSHAINSFGGVSDLGFPDKGPFQYFVKGHGVDQLTMATTGKRLFGHLYLAMEASDTKYFWQDAGIWWDWRHPEGSYDFPQYKYVWHIGDPANRGLEVKPLHKSLDIANSFCQTCDNPWNSGGCGEWPDDRTFYYMNYYVWAAYMSIIAFGFHWKRGDE